MIEFDDFLKVDVRAGTVVEASVNESARKPALKLRVDLGAEVGVKTASAQIVRHYAPADLIGRQVAAVVNFAPRQIGKVISEILVLGFPDAEGEVVLINVDKKVPNGARLF